jgi:hypothetical protein
MSTVAERDGWIGDGAARHFITLGYLPWLAGLSLLWEIAHLPLYTIWVEASPGYIAFAVAHCTAGDVLIGATCLVLALIVGKESALDAWHWPRVAFVTALLGIAYTAFSEWLNVSILQSWAYSDRMPVIELAGLRLGVSPLLQWAVIPPFALFMARRKTSRRAGDG